MHKSTIFNFTIYTTLCRFCSYNWTKIEQLINRRKMFLLPCDNLRLDFFSWTLTLSFFLKLILHRRNKHLYSNRLDHVSKQHSKKRKKKKKKQNKTKDKKEKEKEKCSSKYYKGIRCLLLYYQINH